MEISPKTMIYLDHAATTPVDPEVAQAILPFLTDYFGNPSSIHASGRSARAAVDAARDSLASALHADYAEITFTSSGTESDNLAMIGAMRAAPDERNHLVVSCIEHHAILHTAQYLEKQGYSVTRLPVDQNGSIEPESLAESITDRTALVSIMHANNEIGTIQNVARLARISHEHGALFHTDAVQSFGQLPIHVRGIDCDMLTVSAHKIYGPKGVGALYVRAGTKVLPILFGGSQERERRAGTENVPGIVGFGKAAEMATARRESDMEKLRSLRDRFIDKLTAAIPDSKLNGPCGSARLPNNVNMAIEGVDGAAVLMALDRHGIEASSGSACSSGSIEPSHVLQAIGLSRELATSGIRFTLGHSNSEDEIDSTVEVLEEIVRSMRSRKAGN